MSHTNVDVRINRIEKEEYKKYVLLKAERDFLQAELSYAQADLKNIPEAINEYGFVEITYGNNETMTLVKQS